MLLLTAVLASAFALRPAGPAVHAGGLGFAEPGTASLTIRKNRSGENWQK